MKFKIECLSAAWLAPCSGCHSRASQGCGCPGRSWHTPLPERAVVASTKNDKQNSNNIIIRVLEAKRNLITSGNVIPSMAASLCSRVHTFSLSSLNRFTSNINWDVQQYLRRALSRYFDWFLRGSAAQLCKPFLCTSSTVFNSASVKSSL